MQLVFRFFVMQKNNKNFYEKLSNCKLSDQEVFEARENFVGFYDLLLKIDNRINNKENNERDKRDSNYSD